MLTFQGVAIKCLHQFPQAEKPKLHTMRTQFAGILGVSEIFLGVGERAIVFYVWLTDPSFTSAQAVTNYVNVLDQGVGTNGSLVISGNVPATYGDCTFEGFEPVASVLEVIGGDPTLMPDGTFWQPGRLTWTQLTPGT